MTPERVEFHRLMLCYGLRDVFDQEFDRALEEEDPLSDLTLALASCASDLNQTISVLRAHTLGHPFDAGQVCDMILTDMRGRYEEHSMTPEEITNLLYQIAFDSDRFWDEPWEKLAAPGYALETYEDGLIPREWFLETFEALLYQGLTLDAWELKRKRQPKRKRSWICNLLKKS